MARKTKKGPVPPSFWPDTDKHPNGANGSNGSGGKGKAGFRETGWFKVGAMAEERVGDAGAVDSDSQRHASVPEHAKDEGSLGRRYQDDGSITDDDRAAYGIHTGDTDAIGTLRQVDALPGDQMSDAEIMAEHQVGTKGVVVGVLVSVVALAALVWILL